ncbi:MAG: monovalent cation/H(+) antiporter subunit G [bacterium]|nr:monovalent cation/H(+) antiporter subunit G [bacterium]
MLLDILTISLLITGALIILISAIGMLRLPDLFCRLHALAKSMPLGINLILIATWISLGHDMVGFKTFLAIVFQAVSLPVAGHLMALIAFQKNLPRWKHRPVDRYDEK